MEISPYDNEIESTQIRLTELLKQRAAYCSPFNVDDIITREDGKRAKVTEIVPLKYLAKFGHGYELKGVYQLKDGTYGSQIHEIWDVDRWTSHIYKELT